MKNNNWQYNKTNTTFLDAGWQDSSKVSVADATNRTMSIIKSGICGWAMMLAFWGHEQRIWRNNIRNNKNGAEWMQEPEWLNERMNEWMKECLAELRVGACRKSWAKCCSWWRWWRCWWWNVADNHYYLTKSSSKQLSTQWAKASGK